MGLFEEIAILDLKFRLVMASFVVAFAIVAIPILFILEDARGFLLGGIVGVVVAYYTARRLA